jgi:mannose-1-phosphate guanylyltransferase
VKAVLLAAGRGTRLAPLTITIPKILAPVGGEPLLAHQLRYLAAAGVSEVLMNVHHRADAIEEYLASTRPPLIVTLFHEPELLGTAGALLPMRPQLADERFLVLYGDVVTDADLAALNQGAARIATLAYYTSSDVRDKGILELGPSGRILRFVEKPEQHGEGLVNAGIYMLEPRILDYVPQRGDFGFDVWPRLLEAGEPIYAAEIDGYLLDMGSPDALARLEQDVATGRLAW